jgi:ArsR family transcriptional regulator, arsenate/arsenite/antimonite-responsive transcriptional repressor
MKGKEMAKVFKALSNEQRLNLFRMIYYWQKTMPESECCGVQKAFTRACECMDISRSTISHHLKELQLAGLITCNKEGQALVCTINHELIDEIKNFFD